MYCLICTELMLTIGKMHHVLRTNSWNRSELESTD
jgi:hypothetical protein